MNQIKFQMNKTNPYSELPARNERATIGLIIIFNVIRENEKRMLYMRTKVKFVFT